MFHLRVYAIYPWHGLRKKKVRSREEERKLEIIIAPAELALAN